MQQAASRPLNVPPRLFSLVGRAYVPLNHKAVGERDGEHRHPVLVMQVMPLGGSRPILIAVGSVKEPLEETEFASQRKAVE